VHILLFDNETFINLNNINIQNELCNKYTNCDTSGQCVRKSAPFSLFSMILYINKNQTFNVI